MIDADTTGCRPADQVGRLLYELLDAHIDTIKLAGELEREPCWAAHLDYLRDLQRIGREALARAAA